MGQNDTKKNISIPEWQKKDYITPLNADTNQQKDDLPSLEKAKLFLQDSSIRDTSREHKVAFLQQKGLQNDVIQKALGSEDEFSSTTVDTDLKTVYDSNSSSTASSASTSTSTHNLAKRDIPPIITYPEFLLRPQKPPPLVTWQRLAYAAYGFAGLSALTYATSTYLVQPMLANLTSARHELAEIALHRLQQLNSKLELNVSEIPFGASSTTTQSKSHRHEDGDDQSVDSDPTELFRRDIATQTSPIDLLPSSSSEPLSSQQEPTAQQSTRLHTIHTFLTSLSESAASTDTSSESLKTTVQDFQTFLDNLQFSNTSYRTDYSTLYTTSQDGKRTGKSPHDTDEAGKLKAEIRALKGIFLSSRNFPSGRPMVTR